MTIELLASSPKGAFLEGHHKWQHLQAGEWNYPKSRPDQKGDQASLPRKTQPKLSYSNILNHAARLSVPQSSPANVQGALYQVLTPASRGALLLPDAKPCRYSLHPDTSSEGPRGCAQQGAGPAAQSSSLSMDCTCRVAGRSPARALSFSTTRRPITDGERAARDRGQRERAAGQQGGLAKHQGEDPARRHQPGWVITPCYARLCVWSGAGRRPGIHWGQDAAGHAVCRAAHTIRPPWTALPFHMQTAGCRLMSCSRCSRRSGPPIVAPSSGGS